MLETKTDFARALERLRGRDTESLAVFILSLAQDSGPVGEQVRTFILGDEVGEAAALIWQRIGDLRAPTRDEYRHRCGSEIGERLEFILDSIEKLVLPLDPKVAFELLARVFEADGQAMENCGEHHWQVECAFKRAAKLMADGSKAVPAAVVAAKIKSLMAVDGYGLREGLATVLESR
jgi:hypothetical protein